ncbi:MAG: metallophosphoesterase family protein [Acidobacteriota bacterium]
MRILFFTDTHIRGNAPVNRQDNLLDTLKKKLHEVVDIANDHDVDYVLHGGDFFDNPAPALSVAADCLEIFKGFKMPLYGIFGNHDVYGGNSTTLSRTILGFAARLGVLQLLDDGQKVNLSAHGIKATLIGKPFNNEIDHRSPDNDYIVDKDGESDLTIHMVHGMLMDKADFPGSTTLINDIVATGADITLAGHNHIGFGAVEREGRHFVNPGALVRLSNHVREIERPVQVALLDLTGGAVNCRLISIKTAQPGETVLDRSKIEERESKLLMMERFTRDVRDAADLQRWDVRELIEKLAQSEQIGDKIRAEALNRIAAAEESLRNKEGWE